jgi:hypothetical protein
MVLVDTSSMDAIVFATDETFAPLAKGLVLSLIDSDLCPCLLDIGCSSATLGWMADHGIQIEKFNRNQFRVPIKIQLKPYQDSQLCRPFLPELFPGFEVYVWADADIWVQNIAAIQLYREIASTQHDKIPLSPLIDISYQFFYQNGIEFVEYNNLWFCDVYGTEVARTYGNKAVLNSGLFALHKSSPLWNAWAHELRHIYKREYKTQGTSHVAEQVALNYLVYSRNALVPMDAAANYNCHVGQAKRSPNGRVVIDSPPYREIDIIHLTHSSRMMGTYIDAGLLFDAGRYLTEGEKTRLRSLSHY